MVSCHHEACRLNGVHARRGMANDEISLECARTCARFQELDSSPACSSNARETNQTIGEPDFSNMTVAAILGSRKAPAQKKEDFQRGSKTANNLPRGALRATDATRSCMAQHLAKLIFSLIDPARLIVAGASDWKEIAPTTCIVRATGLIDCSHVYQRRR